MDKIIEVHLKDGGGIFRTSKASYGSFEWGVTGLGSFGNEEVKIEVQIPWTSIAYVLKVIS